MPSVRAATFAFAAAAATFVEAALDSTHPSEYPGMPMGDYSPDWQSYYKVTENLPGIDFNIGSSYAGNMGVGRKGHDDDTLFFWAFEREEGSLTVEGRSTAPWAVWLNGGPGASSLVGLLNENGPISVSGKNSLVQNNYNWNQFADYFWLDQPVGVGYSTADSDGYVADQDQIGQDFVGWLENLVKVFPGLATRPFYLTGQSYAGRYIPYIAKALFSMESPPVQLAKIAIGNPALGSNNAFKTMPTLSLIKTFPQIIGYDTQVYDYFAQQAHLCGLDLNLTYPQNGNFPTIQLQPGDPRRTGKSPSGSEEDPSGSSDFIRRDGQSARSFVDEVAARHAARQASGEARLDRIRHGRSRRDLGGRTQGGIDEWYGCYIWDEMVDYAVNFTYPWSATGSFGTFDVPNALKPGISTDPTSFLNDEQTRNALHAPKNKQWSRSTDYPWNSKTKGGDPSPEPMTFLTELATNASMRNVPFVFFVGNDDAISPHFGTEVSIQNTTFGGTQGFSQSPSTPWYDDGGNFGGIIHQERNWTYAVIYGAGHQPPSDRPEAMFTFAREFIFGSNQTGLYMPDVTPNAKIVGERNPSLGQGVLLAQDEIYTGSRTTAGVQTYPAASIAAFTAHVGIAAMTGIMGATETVTSWVSEPTHSDGKNSAASTARGAPVAVAAAVALTLLSCTTTPLF